MPTVHVVNWNAGHDYQPAERYGELVKLTEGQVSIFATDRLLERLARGLVAFDPQQDYLLLSGNMVVNALALMLLAWRFPRLRLLVFDNRRDVYVPRTVTNAILRNLNLAQNGGGL
jgi:hypothetical protein